MSGLCPKCGSSIGSSEECLHCGVIVAKYSERQNKPDLEEKHNDLNIKDLNRTFDTGNKKVHKTYKVVSGPTNIKVKTGKEQEAFDLFGSIINLEVKKGWDYHSMETINVTTPGGCGSSQPNVRSYFMLIFYQEN